MSREAAIREAQEQFGNYLTTLRTEGGLTQRDVAAQAHVSATLLSQVESGKRNATDDLMAALAPVYGVKFDRLEKGKMLAESAALLKASGADVTATLNRAMAAHLHINAPDWHPPKKTPSETERSESIKRLMASMTKVAERTKRQKAALRREVLTEVETLSASRLEKVHAFIAGLKAADEPPSSAPPDPESTEA